MKVYSLTLFLLFSLNLYAQDSIPIISKNFVLGKFDQTKDSRFILVDSIYSTKPIYLQKEVYSAYKTLYKEALKSKIKLTLISGTRNFYAQKWIWERKWNTISDKEDSEKALSILEYSSMPSTSRHHWGTDLDLVSLSPEFFENQYGKKVYEWLIQNAAKFGFYQVYTDKSDGRTGYKEEKWHWTYLSLSKQYLQFYNEHIQYTDLKGFIGANLSKELKIIERYVNGVSKELIE